MSFTVKTISPTLAFLGRLPCELPLMHFVAKATPITTNNLVYKEQPYIHTENICNLLTQSVKQHQYIKKDFIHLGMNKLTDKQMHRQTYTHIYKLTLYNQSYIQFQGWYYCKQSSLFSRVALNI